MKEEKTAGLVKIGELAKVTGVSVSTLKFYVKEGLLEPKCKTGKNMSWYDPACADTIRTIRALQKERFYPLSVIKELLKGGQGEREMALLDAIHKVDYRSDNTLLGLGEAVRRSRLSAQEITRLSEAGLISVGAGGSRPVYTQTDLSVMSLVRRRMDAGIPFEQTLLSFGIYATALYSAVRAEVSAFISGAILSPGFTAEMGTRLIRVSDDTLDAFVDLKREELNRVYGSGSLEDLYRFEGALTRGLERIRWMMEAVGLHEDAAYCAAALAGDSTGIPVLDRCAALYRGSEHGSGNGIAARVAGCAAALDYFTALDPLCAGSAAVAVWCMKLCWLSLAPDILNCRELADTTLRELLAYLQQRLGDITALRSALPAILSENREAYVYL